MQCESMCELDLVNWFGEFIKLVNMFIGWLCMAEFIVTVLSIYMINFVLPEV